MIRISFRFMFRFWFMIRFRFRFKFGFRFRFMIRMFRSYQVQVYDYVSGLLGSNLDFSAISYIQPS